MRYQTATLAVASLFLGSVAFAYDMYDDTMMDAATSDTEPAEDLEDDSTMDSGMAEDEASDSSGSYYDERRCPGLRVVSCCDDNDLQAYATASGIPLEEADPYMCAEDLLEQSLARLGTSMQGIYDNPERICDQTCAPLAADEFTWADANQYSDAYTSASCDEDSSRVVIDVECYAVDSE